MGWASGSRLFGEVIKSVEKNVSTFEARKAVYRNLIDAFEEHDWDTMDECVGQSDAYDAVYAEMFPWTTDE